MHLVTTYSGKYRDKVEALKSQGKIVAIRQVGCGEADINCDGCLRWFPITALDPVKNTETMVECPHCGRNYVFVL